MASPYIGEIRMFAGNFAPQGWAFCNGQLMAIADNDALFNLIGTTYGGDGQNTFALPDLQGRIPLHMGTSTTGTTYTLAQKAGVETVGLTANQIPVHNHPLAASPAAATQTAPGGNVAAPATQDVYVPPQNVVALSASTDTQGGGQPHDNLMPFLAINFIISLFGVYPSPT